MVRSGQLSGLLGIVDLVKDCCGDIGNEVGACWRTETVGDNLDLISLDRASENCQRKTGSVR